MAKQTFRLWAAISVALLAIGRFAEGAEDPAPSDDVEQVAGESFSEITSLAFSPDGKLLAAGKDLRGPIVLEVETGRVRWTADTAACCAVSNQGIIVEFRPDGKQLLVGAETMGLYSFDVATGARVYPKIDPARLDPTGLSHFAQNVDGSRIIVQSDFDRCPIELYDATAWRQLLTFPQKADDWASCFGFADRGRRLLVGYSSGTLSLHDAANGESLKQIELGEDNSAVAFSSDGTLAVTAGNELWDIQRGAKLADLPAGYEHADLRPRLIRAQFNAQPNLLLTLTDDERAFVIELPSQKVLQTFKFPFEDRIEVATLSSDGRSVATAGWASGKVTMWDVASGRAIRVFEP